MQSDQVSPGERLIRLPELKRMLGLSGPTIYRRIKAGKLPVPVKIGPRLSGWWRSEVERAMHEFPRAELGPEAPA